MDSVVSDATRGGSPLVPHTGLPLTELPHTELPLTEADGPLQPAADRFANGFNNPADFENFFYDLETTASYLAEVAGA